jgi:hypothetical protein
MQSQGDFQKTIHRSKDGAKISLEDKLKNEADELKQINESNLEQWAGGSKQLQDKINDLKELKGGTVKFD